MANFHSNRRPDCSLIAVALLLSAPSAAHADNFTPADSATQALMVSLTAVGTYVGADFGPSAGSSLTFTTNVDPAGQTFSYSFLGTYAGQAININGSGLLSSSGLGTNSYSLSSTINFAGFSIAMSGTESITTQNASTALEKFAPNNIVGAYEASAVTNTTGGPFGSQNDWELVPPNTPFPLIQYCTSTLGTGIGGTQTVIGSPYPCEGFGVEPEWGNDLVLSTNVPFTSIVSTSYNPNPDAFTLSLIGNFSASGGDTVGGPGDVFLSISPAPEPSTLFLLALGLTGVCVLRGRRLKRLFSR